MSDVWQAWCRFSRELFFSSCRGTFARNGGYVAPIGGDLSWKRLGYLAKQASQAKNATPSGHCSFAIRHEPTWGDLDVFIKVAKGVQPNNFQNLLVSYGSFSSLKHLQLVRNSCAHKNIETLTEVRRLSSYYYFNKVSCPTDLAWTASITDHVRAIELWLYEMNIIADLATSSS